MHEGERQRRRTAPATAKEKVAWGGDWPDSGGYDAGDGEGEGRLGRRLARLWRLRRRRRRRRWSPGAETGLTLAATTPATAEEMVAWGGDWPDSGGYDAGDGEGEGRLGRRQA